MWMWNLCFGRRMSEHHRSYSMDKAVSVKRKRQKGFSEAVRQNVWGQVLLVPGAYLLDRRYHSGPLSRLISICRQLICSLTQLHHDPDPHLLWSLWHWWSSLRPRTASGEAELLSCLGVARALLLRPRNVQSLLVLLYFDVNPQPFQQLWLCQACSPHIGLRAWFCCLIIIHNRYNLHDDVEPHSLTFAAKRCDRHAAEDALSCTESFICFLHDVRRQSFPDGRTQSLDIVKEWTWLSEAKVWRSLKRSAYFSPHKRLLGSPLCSCSPKSRRGTRCIQLPCIRVSQRIWVYLSFIFLLFSVWKCFPSNSQMFL